MNKAKLSKKLQSLNWEYYRFYWYTLTFPPKCDQAIGPEWFITCLSQLHQTPVTSWYVAEYTKKKIKHYHGILGFSAYSPPIFTQQINKCWPYRSSVDILYKTYKKTKCKRYVLASVISYIYKDNEFVNLIYSI